MRAIPVTTRPATTAAPSKLSPVMARQDRKPRISTEGGEALDNNPFAALDKGDLPPGPQPPAPLASDPPKARPKPPDSKPPRVGKRGRLEVRRLKAGKGGKTVTEVRGFAGSAKADLPDLAKALKQHCGVGGTVKGEALELQGDQRETVIAWLRERGFQPVAAGG